MPDIYIARQPLVNRQNKLIAIRLKLLAENGLNADEKLASLQQHAEAWPQGEKLVFVSTGTCDVSAQVFERAFPENAVIEILGRSFESAEAPALVEALKECGTSICLDVDESAKTALLSGAKFRFIGFDASRIVVDRLKVLVAQTQSFGIPVAFNVETSGVFDQVSSVGISAAATWFFKKLTQPAVKALAPGQAQIIRLINLVRNNAEVREIEAALKQDVALSYKLLRYINSAGFGLSCEIQSFKHAVTILGYEKLNKWLSLLLATASKDPMAPALMHTALTRARFMELLAHDLVSKSEYDNLFITGAFSMLEPLLGVSMETILESMTLPEAIVDALLGRGGMYAPFLELAIASEGDDVVGLSEQVMMLGLTPSQFNRAQLEALSFASSLDF